MEVKEFACEKAIDEAIKHLKDLKKDRDGESNHIVIVQRD